MNNRKIKTVTSIIITVMTLALAAVGTVSWFTYQQHVEAISSGASIQVMSGALEISDDGTSWGARIDYKNVDVKYMIDISGDGQRFYFPKTLTADDQPVGEWEIINETNNEGFMIWYDVWFRTTDNMEVYLSDASALSGYEKYLSATGSGYDRQSRYGRFSCDGIAGAARVSFVDVSEEDDPQLRFVWVPNDTYRLSYALNNNVQEAFFSETGRIFKWNQQTQKMVAIDSYTPAEALTGESLITRESLRPHKINNVTVTGYQYYYPNENNQMVLYTYTPQDYATGKITVDNSWLASEGSNGTSNINRAVPILSFQNSSSEPVVKKLRIYIWFEGTDNEANRALNGGMVKYNLSFLGINKGDHFTLKSGTDDEDFGQTPLDGIRNVSAAWLQENQVCRLVYKTTKDGAVQSWSDEEAALLKFSENGLEWFQYDKDSGIPGRDTDYDVFVIVSEDDGHRPSDVVKVTIPATP